LQNNAHSVPLLQNIFPLKEISPLKEIPLADKTLTDEEYKKEQTRQLVSRLYGGSVRNLAVSLLGSDEMTADDLAEIRKMFNL